MSAESHRDRVSASSRWTHCAAEVDVDKISELAHGFSVVPAAEVHPLSDELDWGLSAVNFEGRHVQVVDEKDENFAQRWTENSFASEMGQEISEL